MYKSIQEEEALFFLSVDFKNFLFVFEVKVDEHKGALGLREKMIINVLASLNSHCHTLLSYYNSPQ